MGNDSSKESMSGAELRQIRLSLGMTQTMFAMILGMSATQFYRMETGKRPISDKVVKRLANLRGGSEGLGISGFPGFLDFQGSHISSAGEIVTDDENANGENADDENASAERWTALRRYDPRGYERDGHEGERIRFLRKSLNIRQEQFAAAVGISLSWIGLIESGSGKPSDVLLAKIIEAFNVNPSWLLRGEGEMGYIGKSAGVAAASAAAIKKRKSRKLKKLELKDDAQIRYEAIRAVEIGEMSVTESCEHFGFSRETYYKYKRAYDEDGIAGLIMEHKGPWGHRKKGMDDEHSED